MGLNVDNFAGGGGASTGIEMALGRPVDIAINHDPEALAMHAANHPHTRHFVEDVWTVDPREVTRGETVDLAWFSPDCFPAGTVVLTSSGYKPIEDIEVGEDVLTHKLRWRRVTATMSSKRELVKLVGRGHPGILISKEHPVYVRGKASKYQRGLLTECWVKAAELYKGAYWGTPISFPSSAPPEIPVHKNRRTTIDEKLLWLAGRYVADGWTRLTSTRAEMTITCGGRKVDDLRAKLSAWSRKGSRSSTNELAWVERATATAYQFTTSHRGLVEWLREHFGHTATGKKIPSWILGARQNLKSAFLDGYISGDGCITEFGGNPLVQCTTVSKALAFGLRALAGSLGYSPSIYLREENTNVIEGREVNARPSWHVRWRTNIDFSHRQTERIDGIEWGAIRKVNACDGLFSVYNLSVEEDESYVAEGVIVHNCTHFSKSRGGKPKDKKIRGLAWVAVKWAQQVRPSVICLENVEEFVTWGPLDDSGQPIKAQAGETFDIFIGALRGLGYEVDFRELRACDYGAPTTRKRFFLIARCDGEPIVWPERTHGMGKLPYRTAGECIDWTIPCPSIFGREKPLAENTLRRIAKGVVRYVLNNPKPFVVCLNHTAGYYRHFRGQDLDVPLGTITQAPGFAVVAPHITKFRANSVGHGADEPLHAITGGSGGEANHPGAASPLGLVSAFLAKHYGGVVGCPVDRPLGTVTGIDHHSLVACHLERQFGNSVGEPVDAPMGTVMPGGGGKTALVAASIVKNNFGEQPHQDVNAPLHTVTTQGNRFSLVAAFLSKYYGAGTGQELWGPMQTVTSRDRFGLVTVSIEGETYAIADIGMRMLQPRELFRAQGFPDSYVIDPVVKGRPLPKAAQVRMVGNSVCPPIAAAIVRANAREMAKEATA